MATPADSSSCGMADLLDALEDGEGAAEAEQHQGDDEGPEVALAAVAERVRLVGRRRRPAAAEQQQRPGCRSRRRSGSTRPASTPSR